MPYNTLYFSSNGKNKQPPTLLTPDCFTFSPFPSDFPRKQTDMSPGVRKSQGISHIVQIRHMLKQWRKKAQLSATKQDTPSDVPAGHVAICVGASCKRFFVRATYLNHPIFQRLLAQVEEEYGFSNVGPLTIPCDESFFEEILRIVSGSYSGRSFALDDVQRCSTAGMKKRVDFFREARPLLNGFADKSVC